MNNEQNKTARCSWCGHGDRLDRGAVIPFTEINPSHIMNCADSGYTGLHSGCQWAEERARGRRFSYKRERSAHSQLMDIAAGYGD